MEQTNEEVVIGFITANPDSTKATISEGTDLKGLVLFNLLKKLEKEKVVTVDGGGADATYSINENNSEEEPLVEDENDEQSGDEDVEDYADEEFDEDDEDEEKENDDEKNNEPAKDKKAASKPSSRDNSKFKFNGEEYGKGPLVRAVVAKYVEDNPSMTYKQLKEAFPGDLLKRFGIFQDEATAREISGKRDRYFLKETQLIKLKDKKVAVCNQFTAANIQPFLKVAKALGFKIK